MDIPFHHLCYFLGRGEELHCRRKATAVTVSMGGAGRRTSHGTIRICDVYKNDSSFW